MTPSKTQCAQRFFFFFVFVLQSDPRSVEVDSGINHSLMEMRFISQYEPSDRYLDSFCDRSLYTNNGLSFHLLQLLRQVSLQKFSFPCPFKFYVFVYALMHFNKLLRGYRSI